MPSCDEDIEAECEEKDRENVKIENLRILKTIGTGWYVYLNIQSHFLDNLIFTIRIMLQNHCQFDVQNKLNLSWAKLSSS